MKEIRVQNVDENVFKTIGSMQIDFQKDKVIVQEYAQFSKRQSTMKEKLKKERDKQ